jgi:hypothetical protein
MRLTRADVLLFVVQVLLAAVLAAALIVGAVVYTVPGLP